MRLKGITDLDVIWAIRDIPAHILKLNLKSILYTMVATIGNHPNEWFYHSHKDWAPKLGCSSRSVPEFMNRLEALGFIAINRPVYYGNKNYTLSNEYKLNYEFILEIAERFR